MKTYRLNIKNTSIIAPLAVLLKLMDEYLLTIYFIYKRNYLKVTRFRILHSAFYIAIIKRTGGPL
jgi:hypothetical protein